MISRCVRERRRIMRYRLPTSSLKKLESRKYTKNEIYETCAICLGNMKKELRKHCKNSLKAKI